MFLGSSRFQLQQFICLLCLQIFLVAFVPFTAFLLKFVRKKDSDSRLDERLCDPECTWNFTTDDSEDKSPAIYRPLINVTLIGKRENEISYPMAIYRAFRSPIVKCIHFSVSFLSFNFKKSPFYVL